MISLLILWFCRWFINSDCIAVLSTSSVLGHTCLACYPYIWSYKQSVHTVVTSLQLVFNCLCLFVIDHMIRFLISYLKIWFSYIEIMIYDRFRHIASGRTTIFLYDYLIFNVCFRVLCLRSWCLNVILAIVNNRLSITNWAGVLKSCSIYSSVYFNYEARSFQPKRNWVVDFHI